MTAGSENTDLAATAYSDLSQHPQELSREGFDELVAIAARVAASPRYRASVEELGLDDPSELIAELTATGALARVVQNSTDPESFTKQLFTATGHIVIDLYRRTDAGRLARRVADTLRRDDRFQQSDVAGEEGKWCSDSTAPSGEWDGDRDVLINAVWDVDVRPVAEWEGKRRTPVCSDADFVRVIDAIFAAATVPVGLSDIVHAVQHRFELLPAPLEQIDEAAHPSPISLSVESQALDELEAEDIIGLLSAAERVILGAHGMTDRELARLLGCSPAAANGRRRRLAELLGSLGWTDDVGLSSSEDDREMP